LYVADGQRGSVLGYRLDEATGMLSSLSSRPLIDGRGGAGPLAFTPDGMVGFVGTTNETIPVNVGADGTWTPRAGGGLSASQPLVAVHPSGRFLYSSGLVGLDLRAIGKDGAPGKDSIAAYPINARDIFIDTPGRQLAAFNAQESVLSVFDIDPSSGRLTEAPGSPVALMEKSGGARPHPNGLLFFALTYANLSSQMNVFLRTSDGIAPVVGSPFALAPDARSFTLSADGRHLFVAHPSAGAIATYAIDDAGGIHPVMGSPFNAGIDPGLLAADPGGKFLYVSSARTGTVSVLLIAKDSGALSPAPGTPASGGRFATLTATAVPAVVVEAAALPPPDSAALQPIQVQDAPPSAAAASLATASGELPRSQLKPAASPEASVTPSAPALQALKLSCKVPVTGTAEPSPAGTIVSNLSRIPLNVTMEGPRNVRSTMLSVKKDGFQEGDTVEIEFSPLTGQQPPRPVPIRLSTIATPEDTDATLAQTVTHMSLLVEIPQDERYIRKSIDDYITSMLYARGTAAVSKDPVLRQIQTNRSMAAESLRSLFMENPVGTYDIYCTFHLKAAPLEKALVARTRVQIAYRGRFFDQSANFLR
jgi:DNA-binding beta-propeller fold protein YncE